MEGFLSETDAEGNPPGRKELPYSTLRTGSGAPRLSDGSGGVLVTATAGNSAFGGDMVYIQQLDSAGNRLWGGGIRLDR